MILVKDADKIYTLVFRFSILSTLCQINDIFPYKLFYQRNQEVEAGMQT